MDTHFFFPIGCNVFKLSSLNFSLFSSAAISWEQAGDLPVDSTLSSAWRGFSVLVCSKGHLFQLKLLSGWPGSSPGFGSFPRRKQRQMFVTWLHFGREKKKWKTVTAESANGWKYRCIRGTAAVFQCFVFILLFIRFGNPLLTLNV